MMTENISGNKCNIRADTKLRNGYPNWWCYTHFASARGEKGVRLEKCLKADLSSIQDDERINIDIEDYPGGVGVWGALEAIYDTKREVSDRGVHVHLRRDENSSKEVDRTFKEVYIKVPSSTLLEEYSWIKIDEETACAYTASVVFNKNIKVVRCKYCSREHIDAEYFAVHYHKKHFCTFCGRDFFDTEHGISNPIKYIQQLFEEKLRYRKLVQVDRNLIVSQKDYPGGIQIWGSNPAIIWTANRPEESGIHVHLFKEKSGAPSIDDTYGYVEIDGIVLDDQMIRYLMVQKSLLYLENKIVSLTCTSCQKDHFDVDDKAITLHKVHDCEHCGSTFEDDTRYKGVVSNPIVSKLKKLEINFNSLCHES